MSILAQYHIGQDEIYLFIIKKDLAQPKVFKIDTGSFYEEFETCLTKLFNTEVVLNPGEVIRSLIQPLIDESEENETIWIVPNKVLQHLPFHALSIGNTFLGLRNPVCYTPSASTMIYCRKGPRFKGGKILGLGDPTNDLKYARVEASMAVNTFGGDSLLGIKATKNNLFSALEKKEVYDVVHFACHGYANADADDKYNPGVVLASNETLTTENKAELLTATDILRRKINIPLVVISACDAGLIDLKSSDEIFGMTRSLLYSGASSVLLSSWPVDDFSTYLFMKEFYRCCYEMVLTGKGNKAEALQMASKFLFEISLQNVIDLCDAEAYKCIQEGETLKRISFMMDSAVYCLQANDLTKAAGRFREVLSEIKEIPRDFSQMIAELHQQIEEIEFRQLLKQEPIDYKQSPFSTPWHWATFSLFGDWRF